VRPIDRLRTGRKDSTGRVFNFGGTGGSWEQPPFWTGEAVRDAQEIDQHFEGYISGAYKANGIVFTCILIRLLIFSQVRFQFQRMVGGRPTELWGNDSLSLLENPWPNGTTGELLARMEQDASLAGNFFATEINDQDGRRIRRMRPDWVTIVTGSRAESAKGHDPINPFSLDARVVGYMYEPKAGLNRPDPVLLLPRQVCHWSPIPDPDAQWRGMSWLTPIVNEIKADHAATKHKLKYFEHGTVGGIAITYDKSVSQTAVERFAKMWKEQHAGVDNAYKTFHLGGGADSKVLGADLKQLDFKLTQGAGETRIASASGVGAVMAQFSEGLAGSSLNAGNFAAARRRVADIWLRTQWQSAATALSPFAKPPTGNRLWYDGRDVPFLQEDERDAAEIQAAQATTIRTLVDGGFFADDVVTAVTNGDLKSLVGKHSGLFSAQLQEPGADKGGARQLGLVEMVQKIYLGVGSVLTTAEAREILNRAGAELTGPGPMNEG
jgi:phage portal protein BeeE